MNSSIRVAVGARVIAVCVLIASTRSYGQGTLHITFNGPPVQPPGTGAFVQQYFEADMWFRPLGVVGPGNGFIRQGGTYGPFPENGSTYLQASLGDSLQFSSLSGSSFQMLSVDLAEYSTSFPNTATVPFMGYRSDGSMVTTSFTTDGIIDGTGSIADFQTFYFGPEFSNLIRVEIPSYLWSLDNLVLTVPEPTPAAILVLSAVGFWFQTVRHRLVRRFAVKTRTGMPARGFAVRSGLGRSGKAVCMKSSIQITVSIPRQLLLSAAFAVALFLNANTPAAVTAIGPFTGNLSETWESFNDYLTGPRYLANQTGIMGGGAFISNSLMSAYLTNSSQSFGLGSSGNAGVADGTKGMGLSGFAQTATITFTNPVVDFGAYWGAATDTWEPDASQVDPTPSTILLVFSDGSSDNFTYFAPDRSGNLEWHGWHFTTGITSISYSGDFIVIDGLQANVIPEPTAAFILLLSVVGFRLRAANFCKIKCLRENPHGNARA